MRNSTFWRSSSGAASEQDRATTAFTVRCGVVPLQTGVARVEMETDLRAVGLVELVVEEVDDPLEVVAHSPLEGSCSWWSRLASVAADEDRSLART